MKIKGAIFDLDGTLIDSLGAWDHVYKGLGRKYFNDERFRPEDEFDKKMRTTIFVDCIKMIREKYDIEDDEKTLLDYANGILNDYYKNTVTIKEGVIEFLEHLKSNNVKICIASASTPELIMGIVKPLGLDVYFQKVISCTHVGKSKDFPDVFFAAKEYLNTDMEETWVFEDSLTAIKTASAVGFKTVGIYDKNNYGHDEMKKIATVYVGENETLKKLI